MDKDIKFLISVLLIMIIINSIFYSIGFFESPRKNYCNKFCNAEKSDFKTKGMNTICRCYNKDGSYEDTKVDIMSNIKKEIKSEQEQSVSSKG